MSQSTNENAFPRIGVMHYSTALPPLPRYIRRNELRQVVPLGDTKIWEMERRNEFPRRIVIAPRVVVWSLAEVEEWMQQRRRDTESGKAKTFSFGGAKKKRRAVRPK